MALIRNGGVQTKQVAELSQKLAAEIRSPHPGVQPFVYENQIAQMRTYHVTVLWDAWKGLPFQTRSRAILDAYEAADPARAQAVRIALGLTRMEAASTGLLRYAIVPNLKALDPETHGKTLKVLEAEGAFDAGDGPQLRFRTLEDAQNAQVRLQKSMPEALWSLVQEPEPVH